MKNSRQFLIISLIVHLLVFIVLAYIVLPPVDRFREFLDRLAVDVVEVKPVVRKVVPLKDKVEPEAEPEKTSSFAKPPELVAFSLTGEETVNDRTRVTSSGKPVLERGGETTVLKTQPEGKGIALVQPDTLKPIPHSPDDRVIAMAPGFHQDAGSIADASAAIGFPGLRLGPVGSRPGAKGGSTYYIYPIAPPQPRKGADEFAKILPALARGILERATQKKMDIVFVVDTTGSMRDNVRGVKDYIHYFLEPIKEKGIDAALGLVEFTDLEVREAKVIGLTRNQKKFEKWLDRARFYGGEDIPESGYEALLAALERADFRDSAQRFFIFISDAPQHDFDYDGKSRYSLDRIIARLNDEEVRVDVVGADYLPMKQLAWGTGGQWKHIPGGDPLTDVPHFPSMIRSSLARSLPPVEVEDKVRIEFDGSVPDWVDLSYKMLDPRGFKCLGTLTYRIKVRQKAGKVEFSPRMDLSKFRDQPGTYTLIYRIRDSIGNRDVLRRTLELRRAGGERKWKYRK
jgi:hypothetical protein